MLFKITGEKQTVWYYDNAVNQIYDSQKNPIILSELDSAQPYIVARKDHQERYWVINRFDPDKKYQFKYNLAKNVKIQLGLNCNYHCIYCSQSPLTKTLAQKHIELDKLYDMIRKSPINWDNVHMVEYWGGEPLVYWKYIVPLTEFLVNEMHYKGMFHITTNASLFTQQVYDFCVKYKFDILFSHDGVNHKQFRNADDWLDHDDIVERVRKYHQLFPQYTRIGLVYAPFGDLDIFKSLELFYNKLGADFDVMFHSGIRLESSSKHLLAYYTPENVEKAVDYMFKANTLPPNHKYYGMLSGNRDHMQRDMSVFILQRLVASYNSKCPTINKHVFAFNLNGECITCHQNTVGWHSHGTIDQLNDPTKCYMTNMRSIHHQVECDQCPYLQVCGSKCPLYDFNDQIIECRSTQWRVKAHFQVVWYYLFNERPIKFERCDQLEK